MAQAFRRKDDGMTETLPESRAGQSPRPRRSVLATRAGNTLRYSLMNLFILLGTVGMALGGPFVLTGIALSFVLYGFVDELFGDAGSKEDMPPVWYMQLMLYLTLPLLILATLVTFNVVSATGWPWLDAAFR